MNMLKKTHLWFLSLIMAALVGCGQTGGVVTPQTHDQRVYAAYGLYVTLVNTTADMLELGTLSREQGLVIQDRFQAVRPHLDRLRRLVADGTPLPESELEALQMIQQILLEVQIELQRRVPR